MISLPACVVVVAPTDGRVRQVATPGTAVGRGDVVAFVDLGGRAAAVLAPTHGEVAGALASPDQTISAGEGVVWLRRP